MLTGNLILVARTITVFLVLTEYRMLAVRDATVFLLFDGETEHRC
jgi:hypothetical protein